MRLLYTTKFPPRVKDGVKLEAIRFSPEALIKACKRVKPKLTSGPDGYPPYLLKEIIRAIAGPLSVMVLHVCREGSGQLEDCIYYTIILKRRIVRPGKLSPGFTHQHFQ